jgi:hypothetical protein
VRQGLSTNDKNSRMFKNVKKDVTPGTLSNPSSSWKHLCVSGGENLDSSQEHICIWEVIEEKKFHEKHQEYLGETDKPWTTSDEEQTKEPENEEFLPCLSSDPLCIQETNQQIVKYMNGMTKEDIQISVDEQANQGKHDYIELWFQTTIRLRHHSILQYFLTSSQSEQVGPSCSGTY